MYTLYIQKSIMNNLVYLFIVLFHFNFAFAETENLIKDFDDWQLFCQDSKKLEACEIRQFVLSDETEEIISFISLTINPEGKSQMLIGLPHMINLKVPAQISVDGINSAEVNYTYCNTNACFIAEVLNEEYLDILKSGNKLLLVSRFIDNEYFNMDYSLSGFTSAYTNLLKSF